MGFRHHWSRDVLRTSLDPALSVAYNAGAWQHALPTTSTHTPSPHGASLQKKILAHAHWAHLVWEERFFKAGPDRLRCNSATSIPHTTTSLHPAGRPRLIPRGPRTPSGLASAIASIACSIAPDSVASIDIPQVCIRPPNANSLDDIRRLACANAVAVPRRYE